jgi:hypothetical protein
LRENDVNVETDQLSSKIGEVLVSSFGPAVLKGNILSLNIAEIV